MEVFIMMMPKLLEFDLSLQQVMELKAGDVIPVDMPEFIQVYLEDLPTYRAEMGQRSGHIALKITHKLERPETVKNEMHFLTRKGVRIDSEADLDDLEESIDAEAAKE